MTIQVVLLSPNSSEDQKKKKRSSPKIEVFSSKSGEDPKSEGLHRNSELFSAKIGRIYLCWLALFRLIIQRSNFDGEMPNSRWGDASPYNLSTGPNNVPAGRLHSSGPKEKGLRQIFRPFFGRIDGRPKKKKGESVAKTTKKGFRQEMRIISEIYCCISIIEKKRSPAN